MVFRTGEHGEIRPDIARDCEESNSSPCIHSIVCRYLKLSHETRLGQCARFANCVHSKSIEEKDEEIRKLKSEAKSRMARGHGLDANAGDYTDEYRYRGWSVHLGPTKPATVTAIDTD